MYAALIATMRYQELNQSDRARLSQLWATVAIKSRTYFRESLPRCRFRTGDRAILPFQIRAEREATVRDRIT